MINRQQHIMILGLYTLFSVFLGVVSITLSDSFYVGIGGFFAFFLTFVCVHIFLLGQNVTTKIMNVLYNIDDNKNAYQQDLKNIRDVVNNVTDIMTNLVNDNNDLQQEIQNHYRKYDTQLSDFKTKIEKLETDIHKNMHHQTHQAENPAFEKHYVTPEYHAQSEMNVRTIHTKPEKNKHTVLASPEPERTLSSNTLDEDFLNSYTDDSFSDLTFPKVIERPLSTINLHDVDDDDEFAIVDQKIADTYQHLLEDVPEANPEAFLEEKKHYQPNKPDIPLKKQSDGIPPLSIKAPHIPNITMNASDFSDEFIDVTADLIHNEIDSNKKTDNNKENGM